MIYILPTRHDMQFGIGNTSKYLLERIASIIKEYEIRFIAEEVPPDMLGTSISEIGRFAYNKDLLYLKLDPSVQEAKDLKMPMPEEIDRAMDENIRKKLLLKLAKIKELFWLNRLVQIGKNEKILLVCGAAHVSTNPESYGNGIDILLRKKAIEVVILDNFL